jgi:hypothetical protein
VFRLTRRNASRSRPASERSGYRSCCGVAPYPGFANLACSIKRFMLLLAIFNLHDMISSARCLPQTTRSSSADEKHHA